MEISSLPRDVLLDILMRLPVEPLIRFSLSSKQYLSLIHHPRFINRHLSHSKIYPSRDGTFLLLCYHIKECTQCYSLCSFTDGGETRIEHKRFEIPFIIGNGNCFPKLVGSSNGLVCLSDSQVFPHPGDSIFLWNVVIGKYHKFPHPGDSIILWNVVIGKYKKLPQPYLWTHPHHDSFCHLSIGFGFVLGTNDFKVVQIMCYGGRDSDEVPDVMVYSMELNTWRKIETNIALCSNDRFRNSNVSVYVNGAVHWLAFRFKNFRAGGFPYSIMSFDMKEEVFKEMALPKQPNIRRAGKYYWEMCSSACGETLTLFLKSDDGNQWEVWLMKEYGVVDSWTRQFCIADGQISLPWKVMDNGDVLLEARSGHLRKLVLCDAESQQIKDFVLCDAKNQKMMDLGKYPMKPFSMVTCSSSLSLLDEGEKVLG